MKKYLSRKFILTVIVVVGAIANGLRSVTDPKIQVASIVVSGVATIAYNLIEGKIDAVAIQNQVNNIVTEIKDKK